MLSCDITELSDCEWRFKPLQIDQLRAGIQTLASSAAPLGKVLDYLQEDLDSMQKELENWRSENKYHETAIKAEERWALKHYGLRSLYTSSQFQFNFALIFKISQLIVHAYSISSQSHGENAGASQRPAWRHRTTDYRHGKILMA